MIKHKKKYGQHFLKSENIAIKIVNSLMLHGDYRIVLEVGPGAGALTRHLVNKFPNLYVIDIDEEVIEFIQRKYPALKGKIIHADLLEMNMKEHFSEPFAVIGNFPYNISSQILFKVLEHKHLIPEVVGMFQKEVARRIASSPGNKEYGILSVLVQAYYKVVYLFEVGEQEFSPPPKVKSAVIRLERKSDFTLDCDEKLFFKIVKAAFNQRRKMLRNALSQFPIQNIPEERFLTQRAEQLTVEDYIQLTKAIKNQSSLLK